MHTRQVFLPHTPASGRRTKSGQPLRPPKACCHLACSAKEAQWNSKCVGSSHPGMSTSRGYAVPTSSELLPPPSAPPARTSTALDISCTSRTWNLRSAFSALVISSRSWKRKQYVATRLLSLTCKSAPSFTNWRHVLCRGVVKPFRLASMRTSRRRLSACRLDSLMLSMVSMSCSATSTKRQWSGMCGGVCFSRFSMSRR
mmetsp:Transcript_12786/g.32603  ORF Transcript_12786/g.32603 Transcript_12786/m.32603 type:complete len:200 (-) Transcript_12786:1262-1861(-)